MKDFMRPMGVINNKNKDLDNGGWSDRDALPTGDPIGDVDEKSDPMRQFKKDQEKYLKTMQKNVINPNDKNFDIGGPCIDYIDITIEIPQKKKCNCGVAKTYKNPSLKMHSDWCELRS